MSKSKVTSLRLSLEAKAQLSDLQTWQDMNMAEVIHTAVNRWWDEENKLRNPDRCKVCGTPYTWYPRMNSWLENCDCEDYPAVPRGGDGGMRHD